jgi:hypothetical protein
MAGSVGGFDSHCFHTNLVMSFNGRISAYEADDWGSNPCMTAERRA